MQWFRDGLGLIGTAPEIETLARTVDDNGGCYIVPAFSGLFAPHWRSEARGIIVGLTSYITKGHLARAVLEATAWQTREVVDAMNADSGLSLKELKADGGMTSDNLLMQFVADMLTCRWSRPMVAETVSLGAAYAAGLAVGYWAGPSRGCAATGTGPPGGSRRCPRSAARPSTTTGGAPSSAPSAGSAPARTAPPRREPAARRVPPPRGPAVLRSGSAPRAA